MKLLHETPIDKDFAKKPTILLLVNQCKGTLESGPKHEFYSSVSQCTEKEIDLGSITQTQAAKHFYAEQERAKQILDTIEKGNDEFWEAVHNFTRYPTWYTGDLDLATSVWKDKCKENSFLENDCTHGKDCQRKNKCNCTSKWEVEQNEKTQEEQYQLDHNLKRKSKRQKRTEVTRY